MKFKVNSKDFLIFLIFCIFLLLLSSLAVVNAVSIINEGKFVGFDPFLGFSSDYIIGTFGVFIGALIVIFASVSSYIFDRSKGFGLSLGEKEEKGYNRFTKDVEMKKAFKVARVDIAQETADVAGMPLINDGKTMWVDNGEYHTLVVGATGSGKTTALVHPLIHSLIKKGESMVVTDPKGEIYKEHAERLKSRGYNIIVLNFRDPHLGNAWNPLTLPYKLHKEGNVDKATELLDDIGNNIFKDKKAQDPFWENSASDYFAGVALGLFQDAKEEEINLNSISYATTVGDEKFAGNSTYIKEYFLLKGEQSSAYTFASNTINAPKDTQGGILSVFRSKIRLFASREQLSEMLSYSDFDMSMIGKEKTAVFMVIHDEKTTYHALATIFIKQCYETLIDVAQKSPNGKLPFRTNFILDEFANMPPLKDVTTMVTAARSRDIRMTMIIQNFAQLNDVYGKDDAETIRGNCGNLIYLLTTELAALEEISKLCGEKKSKEKDKTASTPLVTVSDLQKMKMNEVIIIRQRMSPFRTKLIPSYQIDWGKKYPKAEFFERKTNPIALFDLREFVRVRKHDKIFNQGGMNPFMKPNMPGMPSGMGGFNNMPSGPNPFGPSGMSNMNQNPFGQNIPMGNDFMNKPSNEMGMSNPGNNIFPGMPGGPGGVNVDDFLKKLDAQIAALEEEERQLNASKSQDKKDNVIKPMGQNSNDDKDLIDLLDMKDDEIKVEKQPEKIERFETFNDILKANSTEKELVENKKQERIEKLNDVVIGEDAVTDDEFFDDFFGDD